MRYEMHDVDEVRQRTGCSYAEAKEALDLADGDVLEAVIKLEAREGDETFVESFISRTKELVNEGFISQIRVIKNNQVIFDIPVVAGVAIMAIWTVPSTAALLFALASKCDVKILRRDGTSFCATEVTAERLSSLFRKIRAEYEKWAAKREESRNDESCEDSE